MPTARAKLAHAHRHVSSAALFWGECIEMLDAKDYDGLRAVLAKKLKGRLADAEKIEEAIKGQESTA